MLIRLMATIALMLLPAAALADDPAPSDSPAPASASYMLGPSQAGNNAGGSSGDSLKLQSAGTSPLQSQASDSNGLTAPNSSVLQAPANSDQALRVLAGEADGSPVQLSDSTGLSAWAWFGMPLLLALIVAGAAYFLRRHPQLHRPLTRHLPKPNLRLPRLPIRKSRG